MADDRVKQLEELLTQFIEICSEIVGEKVADNYYSKTEIDRLLENLEKKETLYEIPKESQFYGVNTSKALVERITNGWNLANTLESTGSVVYTSLINTAQEAKTYETLWGEPETTKELLQFVKDAGFNAIRIPVTWSHHIIDRGVEMKISPYWMARVKQIVDWCMELDLVAIVNTHHDHSSYNETNPSIDGPGKNAWLYIADNDADHATIKSRLGMLWKQIAEEFKEYDNRLVFEAYNEIQSSARNWKASTQAQESRLTDLAQQFVNTVRATGGNNINRFLCLNTYMAGSSNNTMFTMPTDTIQNALIIQVHTYNSKMYQEAQSSLDIINTQLITKYPNYPVIIGENATTTSMTEADRAVQIKNYVARCKLYGIKQFWWDGAEYVISDRKNLVWKYPAIIEGMKEGLTSGPLQEEPVTSYTTDGAANLNLINGAIEFDGSICTDANGITTITASSRTRVTSDYYEVKEGGNKVKLTMIDGDGGAGYRFIAIGFYDQDKKFLYAKCPRDGATESPAEYTTLTPLTCKYIRYSIYNPWNSYSLTTFKSKYALTSSVAGGITTTIKEFKVPDNEKADENLRQFWQEITLEDFMKDYKNKDLWQIGEFNTSTGEYDPTVIDRICTKKFITIDPGSLYKFTVMNMKDTEGRTLNFKMATYGQYHYALASTNVSSVAGIREFTSTRRSFMLTLYQANLGTLAALNESQLKGTLANEVPKLEIVKLEGYISQTVPVSDITGGKGLDDSGKTGIINKDWGTYPYYDVSTLTDKNFTVTISYGTTYLCQYKTDGTLIKKTGADGGVSVTLENMCHYIRFCTTWYNSSTICKMIYKSDSQVVTKVGDELPDEAEPLAVWETKVSKTRTITYSNGLADVVNAIQINGHTANCIAVFPEGTISQNSAVKPTQTSTGINAGEYLYYIIDIASMELPDEVSSMQVYSGYTDVAPSVSKGTSGLIKLSYSSKKSKTPEEMLTTGLYGNAPKVKMMINGAWLFKESVQVEEDVQYKFGNNPCRAVIKVNEKSYEFKDLNQQTITLASTLDGIVYDALSVDENQLVTLTQRVQETEGIMTALEIPIITSLGKMEKLYTLEGENTITVNSSVLPSSFSITVKTAN